MGVAIEVNDGRISETSSEGSLRERSRVMTLMDGDRDVTPRSRLVIENVSSISMVEVNEAMSTREVDIEIEGGSVLGDNTDERSLSMSPGEIVADNIEMEVDDKTSGVSIDVIEVAAVSRLVPLVAVFGVRDRETV